MVGNRGLSPTLAPFAFKAALLVIMGAGIPAGCGDSVAPAKPYHPVKGTVKLEAAGSLANLKIIFVPTTQGGRSAIGEVQSDGSFELKTPEMGDGIAEGTYNVHLERTNVVAKGGKLPPSTIPSHYLDPEGGELTATINADTTEIPPFVLSGKSKKSSSSKNRD